MNGLKLYARKGHTPVSPILNFQIPWSRMTSLNEIFESSKSVAKCDSECKEVSEGDEQPMKKTSSEGVQAQTTSVGRLASHDWAFFLQQKMP